MMKNKTTKEAITPSTLTTSFSGKRVHILGVAGTLMGAFAVALARQGIQVTGTDQNIYPPMSNVLAAAEIKIFTGYSPQNIQAAKPDLVIVGNVIRKTNTEMEAVLAAGIPYISLPAAFETMILPHKHSLVVAGTHGKTTTTSMLAWILEHLGEDPSFFIGGVPHNFNESLRVTGSRFMALEGDEYDTAFFDKVPKFTHYLPTDAILTSVEFDHADIYKDAAAVEEAFVKLARLIPEEGHLIVCQESATALRVCAQTKGKVISYGFDPKATARGEKLVLNEAGASFTFKGVAVELAMGGKHNALNALACLVLVDTLALDLKRAAEALRTFKGIKRRQEIYGVARGITLMDDFAHHPTAVKETLAAVRSKNPKARILAFFEPRSATSRRRIFQAQYAESFDQADKVFISKPYDQSGIDPTEQFSSEELIQDIKARKVDARIFNVTDSDVKEIASQLKAGDLLLVMSNGGFEGLLPKLLTEIKAEVKSGES